MRVFYLPVLDEHLRDILMRMELTKSVLGEEFLVSNFPANIARPGSRSMALHSNQSMMLPEPWLDVWAVNVKWCLTRMTKENGATLYISGSNKWTRWEDVFCECSGPADPVRGGRRRCPNHRWSRLWRGSGSKVTEDEDRATLSTYQSAPYIRQLVIGVRSCRRDCKGL